MDNTNIIYFTATFPYGFGEMWKYDELATLSNTFANITVVPFDYGFNKMPVALPKGVQCTEPLTATHSITKYTVLKYLFFSKCSISFWKNFFVNKRFTAKQNVIAWYNAIFNVVFLISHPYIKNMIGNKAIASNTVLLFFWGKGSAEMVPFIDTRIFKKVIIKMHRFDLFENLYKYGILFRKQQIKKATLILPSHVEGYNYLTKKYPQFATKFVVNRVGTKPSATLVQPTALQPIVDGNSSPITIFSCSTLTTVKRVHIMLQAASNLPFTFNWYHIGNGTLSKELEQLQATLKLQGKFHFLGFIPPNKLKQTYLQYNIDVFVNTSESEGIPVSILEMLSLGVPIIATDVGSVREAVDDTVGKLLPVTVTGEQLAAELTAFYHKVKYNNSTYANACVDRFNQIGNSDIANKQLVDLIKL